MTDPCGTPDVTGQLSEAVPRSVTVWVRSRRKAAVQSTTWSQIPIVFIFYRSFAWLTLSKALLKSSKHASTSFPASSSFEMSLTSSTS